MIYSLRYKLIILQTITSILIAGIVFYFILAHWYPSNYLEILQLDRKIIISLLIFIIIGPFMSFLFLKPHKKKLSKIIDFCIILLLQYSTLLVLLQIAAVARPLALVFEVDRFKVITYSDIPEHYLPYVPKWFSPWTFKSEKLPIMGLSKLQTLEEKMASVEQAFQGVDAGQDPKRWIILDERIKDNILSRARPVAALIRKYPDAYSFLKNSNSGKLNGIEDAVWIPIVSRHSYTWVAVMHPNSAEILGFLPFDGFID